MNDNLLDHVTVFYLLTENDSWWCLPSCDIPPSGPASSLGIHGLGARPRQFRPPEIATRFDGSLLPTTIYSPSFLISTPHSYSYRMGAVASSIRAGYDALSVFWAEMSQSMADSDALLRRIATPAFPVSDPTTSFWQMNPPFPKLVDMQSKRLPPFADIVIIGSGLSGASVAYTILSECHELGAKKNVVIVEARETCSGATGRNGGHMKCSPYSLYSDLRKMLGPKEAQEVLKFYRRHLPLMLDLVKAEKLEGTEAREIKTVDVFMEKSAWEKGLGMVRELRKDIPEAARDIEIWDAEDARRVSAF